MGGKMEAVEDDHQSSRSAKFRTWMNKAEQVYLAVLRAMALIAATLLLVYATWLAVSGIYKVSRDATSVEVAEAQVRTEDITNILDEVGPSATKIDVPSDAVWKDKYNGIRQRYFALYKNHYASALKSDDKAWKELPSAVLPSTKDWLEAVKQGDIRPSADIEDLELLIKGMNDATSADITVSRISAYKKSKKVAVSRTVTDMKTETYCDYYSDYFDHCYSWGSRQVPVKRTVTEQKLPKGIYNPNDLFVKYHENFVQELSRQRDKNDADAESQRSAIHADNVQGEENFLTALQVIGIFGALMFLFLLIAVERHQRKIAAQLPVKEA